MFDWLISFIGSEGKAMSNVEEKDKKSIN